MSWITNVAAHAPSLLTVWPLLGALVTWLGLRRGIATARIIAITAVSLTAGLTAVMTWNFSFGQSGVQMLSVIPWWEWPLQLSSPGSTIRFAWAFGVDGVSLAPLLIVAFVGWFAIVLADRTMPVGKEPPYAGLLVGQALSLSLFTVQDFAAWMLCCELWSWWAFLMIGRHGAENRRAAAKRVLLSARLAHGCWMLAGIGMAVCLAWIHADVRHQAVGVTFLYSDLVGVLPRWIGGNLTALQLWTAFGSWVLLFWLAGLWLKWPLFPGHHGLTGMLTESRAPLAALCGATMILQGGYVWFRFVLPLLPAGSSAGLSLLSACAGFGVLYFGLLATVQRTWLALAGMLAASTLQAAWLCSTTGGVLASVTGWRMVCATAVVIPAMNLLTGWRERHALSMEFDQQTWQSEKHPRWFQGIALCSVLLAGLPCFALFSGQAVLNLLELRRRGMPSLMLLAGSLLSAWAVIRILLQTGFSASKSVVDGSQPSKQRMDIQGREWLLTVPVIVGVGFFVSSGPWDRLFEPTWQRLHDPFAVTSSPPSPAKVVSARMSTSKPNPDVQKRSPEFPWLCAPLFWGVVGTLLLVLPREWLTTRWAFVLALIGWAGGAGAELLGGSCLATVSPTWARGCLSALTLIMLIELTAIAGSTSRSAAAWGAQLLRISGIGWTVVTNDLLWTGLAWELAELGRWSSSTEEQQSASASVLLSFWSFSWGGRGWNASPQAAPAPATQPEGQRSPERRSRAHLRHLSSSLCFWLGIALLALVMRTTRLASLADVSAALMPPNDDGPITGVTSILGLAAGLLLSAGVGIRCGLLPWSFGRWQRGTNVEVDSSLLDQWLSQLLGLTMMVPLSIALGGGFGGPLAIVWAISAVATAIWNGLTLVGEEKVLPLLRGLITAQFAALTALLAGVMAKPPALSTGISEQFDISSLLPLINQGTVVVTLAVCSLVALLRQLGKPEFGERYFEHYRGLLARRPVEAILLISLFIGLSSPGLFAVWLPAWTGLTSLIMTPLPRLHIPILGHPVLLTAAAVCLLMGMIILSRIADAISRLAFDQPVSLPTPNSHRWPLILTSSLTVAVVVASVVPNLILWVFD